MEHALGLLSSTRKTLSSGAIAMRSFTEQAPGAFGASAGGPAFGGGNYAGSSKTCNQSISAGWTYTLQPDHYQRVPFWLYALPHYGRA